MSDDENPLDENYKANYQDLFTTYTEALNELSNPKPAVKFHEYLKFNDLTGGFRSHEFSILCGATGVGKTTFLANLSADLIKAKVPHFVASVETGHTDYVKRIMSALYGKDINRGDVLPKEEVKKVHEAIASHFVDQTLYLSLYDNRISVEKMKFTLKYMRENYGCKIAFIDNLNFLLEVKRAQDHIIEMDRVTHELIVFCKRIDMHILMVMHPRKTDGGRVESEFDIKGSSTAVQESHNVFLLNRPKKEMICVPHVTDRSRELKIAKMRRRGLNVGKSLIFNQIDGVKYIEGGLYEPDYN